LLILFLINYSKLIKTGFGTMCRSVFRCCCCCCTLFCCKAQTSRAEISDSEGETEVENETPTKTNKPPDN